MWTETKIEKLLQEELSMLGSSVLNHDKFYGQYEQVRRHMCKDIYPSIAKTEPNLTDHGETHIQNVLINAYKLIEYSLTNDNKYSALELYVLCTTILIHDVGNIHGRSEHEQALTNVYNSNTVFSDIDSSEKIIVAKIATSHGGEENAISGLSSFEHISGEEIQSQCIAGLLRFADELAEGPQRTSDYMLENNLISDASMPFHQYARISDMPVIQQDTIILKYRVVTSDFLSDELEKLLLLLYSRVYKLNRERINCGIYSKHIQRVKKVSITIDIYAKNVDVDTISTIDNNLIAFELNNLNCNRIDQVKIKEKYTDALMTILTPLCKVGENNGN